MLKKRKVVIKKKIKKIAKDEDVKEKSNYTKDDVWILMRAYNEENAIKKSIEDLKANGYKNILVVDDGSTDKTYEIAKAENVLIVRHLINLGGGAAFETGRQILTEIIKAPIIVTFDADYQHDAKDIEKFIKKINQGYDVVLGSRFLGKAINMPLSRKLILKGGILFTWFISGIKLTDTHNGLRAFKLDALKRMKLHFNDFSYASELLDYIKKLNLKYCEVPVTIRYLGKQHGQSNFSAIIIAIKMILKKLLFW